MVMITSSSPAGMAAAPVPSAQQILHRMLLMIADIPNVVSADAEFRLRVRKALNEPPDCVFRGTAKVVRAHPTVRIGAVRLGCCAGSPTGMSLGGDLKPRSAWRAFSHGSSLTCWAEKSWKTIGITWLRGMLRTPGMIPAR